MCKGVHTEILLCQIDRPGKEISCICTFNNVSNHQFQVNFDINFKYIHYYCFCLRLNGKTLDAYCCYICKTEAAKYF